MSATDGVDAAALDGSHGQSTITLAAAVVCLVWYIAVAIVCTVGYVQM